MEIVRVNVDIADYKKQRSQRLEERAQEWLKQVKETGNERHLPTMNAADRRTIHRLASENGLETESVGEGRDRHIVLMMADGVITAEDSSEATHEKTDEAGDTKNEDTKDESEPES